MKSSLSEQCSNIPGFTAETSMRQEKENSANECSALASDDEFNGDVNLPTMNDADDRDVEELVLEMNCHCQNCTIVRISCLKNMHMIVTKMFFGDLRSTVRSLQG